MRKALTITLVAALALFAGSAAYANYCARDIVPASTILVPFAVQDYTGSDVNFGGYTTVLTITNVSKDAQIIHITVWNAVSSACLDFNEVLTGYDMWQIFFRDMLRGNFGAFDTSEASGAAPNTGNRIPFEWGPDGRSAYAPPTLAGLPVPEKTTVLPTTDCQMPYGDIDVSSNVACLRLPLTARSHYGCDHVGDLIDGTTAHKNIRSKFVGHDWLANLSDNPLFFYVTVDVVNICNFLFPSDVGYFAPGGAYLNENVLIGDVVYLSADQNFSEAVNAVHIESQIGANNTTFANFYKEKAAANDKPFVYTEPLATALAFDYYNNALVTSSVIMWKNFAEFRANGQVDDCGAYLYYTWDQDEHTISRAGSCQVSPCSVNDIDPNEFPFETQMVPITTDNFDLAGSAGWMLVIFPPSYGYAIGYDPTAPADNHFFTDPYMAWAALKINYGSYTAGLEAATMANYHCFHGQVQPQLGVNYFYGFVPPTE